MHEFQSVISDIAEMDEFHQWRKLRRATFEASASDVRLIATTRTELLHVAVLMAVTSGIANAIESASNERALIRALPVYAPTHSRTFMQSVDQLLQSILPIDDGAKLQAYLARFDLATRLTRNFETQCDAASGFDVPDAEPLADAWRRAAAAALQMLGVFTDALASPEIGSAKEETARVQGLLRMATAGNSPCLDSEGRISIPGWAERRRERRRSVNVPARVLWDKRLLSVIIRDLSPTGFGIECPTEIAADAEISVLLPDSRRLAGRVAWSNAQRIGVELRERLPLLDPLLAAQ